MGSRLLVLLLLLVLVFAFSNGFDLLFRLAYVMGGVALFSAIWAWTGVQWLQVSIKRETERTQVGQSFEDTIEIRNTSRLPKPWLELRDNSDIPQRNATSVIDLPQGKSELWSIRTTCFQRGRFILGPITLSSTDPFGLFRWERTEGKPHHILVYPMSVPLPHFLHYPAHLIGEGPLHRRTHHVTPNASGVRDYAFGDSFNRIHWRSTAHTGKLMVKEFELDPSSDVWVVLDMQRAVQAGSGEEATDEYGVIIASSVAKRFLVDGRAVGFISWGQRLNLLSAEKGAGQFDKIMESLALIRAEGTIPVSEIIAKEGKRFSRHSTLIVITPSVSESWVAELRYLMSRKITVVAVFVDSSTFDGGIGSLSTLNALAVGGIPTYAVRRGDAIGRALSETPFQSAAPLATEVAV
ncbi:MAG: DUF58 domain-containing protein [Chloroflexota bacterium]